STTGGNLFAAGPFAGDGTEVRSILAPNFGFSFLRPFWTANGLNLQAPVTNPAVRVIDPFGDLANSVAFVPRIDLKYDATALGFEFGTSATFMNLHGNLERTVQLTNGTADLLSTGDLTFIVVNVAEISKRIRAADLPWTYFQECRPQNDTYLLTLGSRYAS